LLNVLLQTANKLGLSKKEKTLKRFSFMIRMHGDWYATKNSSDDQIGMGLGSISPLVDSAFDLTPWSREIKEQPPVAQPLNHFATFHGTRRFITVLKRALKWSLS
jgi:hypothetical protein